MSKIERFEDCNIVVTPLCLFFRSCESFRCCGVVLTRDWRESSLSRKTLLRQWSGFGLGWVVLSGGDDDDPDPDEC